MKRARIPGTFHYRRYVNGATKFRKMKDRWKIFSMTNENFGENVVIKHPLKILHM
jgi:hypothetical protein